MKRLLIAVSFLAFTTTTFAQPPGIGGRWSGNTALVPPQGYSQGDPLTLTWGFMALGAGINDNVVLNGNSIPNAPNNLQTFLNGIYGNQATWQPHFQSVFDRWSSISGLTYQFEAADDGQPITNSSFPTGIIGTRADVRIGGKPLDGNSGVLAYNYGPNAAEMVIDTNDNFYANNLANNSRAMRNVVAHEHGHGLGMAHVDPPVGKTLMERFVSTAYDGPQLHDILVAQRAYGDATEKSNAQLGNDTFNLATSLGAAIGIGQNRSVGNSPKTNMANNNNVVAFNAVDFVSIDDTSDTDFWSFTISTPGRITLLLEALGITYEAQAVGAGTFNFNIRDRSDLVLTLFGTDGTTSLLSVNNTGLGGDETLTFDLLAAGTYFARITGTNNGDASSLDTQFYALTASLAALSVPEPTTIALIGGAGIAVFAAWKRRRRLLRQQMDKKLRKA